MNKQKTHAREFEEGPINSDYVRDREDGQFILGAMYATGQPLPDTLQTLSCPATTK